ncbi:hypothetical protein GCM10007876_27600 [Litoribrevibacter albus]|uniref:Uncharacterized protein n=1 Tax=Litoribrevibacter albus TaxID=1473156 RepID=A0AA37SBI7_9GAMM|nr:hypothetical protein GCM10007876_27600 [Litoribrevibacter albus]
MLECLPESKSLSMIWRIKLLGVLGASDVAMVKIISPKKKKRSIKQTCFFKSFKIVSCNNWKELYLRALLSATGPNSKTGQQSEFKLR